MEINREYTTEYIVVPTALIKECIEMLSTDGQGTKQEVKQKLEEIVQWKEKN